MEFFEEKLEGASPTLGQPNRIVRLFGTVKRRCDNHVVLFKRLSYLPRHEREIGVDAKLETKVIHLMTVGEDFFKHSPIDEWLRISEMNLSFRTAVLTHQSNVVVNTTPCCFPGHVQLRDWLLIYREDVAVVGGRLEMDAMPTTKVAGIAYRQPHSINRLTLTDLE